ncbi:MAG: hypothetical protein WA906_13210 [Pacificimonas sp.]
MLTKADDYPIHQRPEPIATAGSDRNFYDRYFFNGYSADGETFFAAAMGVYPHLGTTDAALCLSVGDAQHSVFAARTLKDGERMDTAIAPIKVEIVEPLHQIHLSSDGDISCDLVMTGRAPPIEEPRFTYRLGTRTIMDATRLTQAVTWSGWIERDGVRYEVDGWRGTRDRSWGVRPIGARDEQPPIEGADAAQFFWLWAPLNFDRHAVFWHTNDDAAGGYWNRAGRLQDLETGETRDLVMRVELDYLPGTRNARAARLIGDGIEIELTPQRTFFMTGIGYGHPTRGHGTYHGDHSVMSETLKLAEASRDTPLHTHVQELSTTRMTLDGDVHEGQGILEQLIIGPHEPSGFKALFDVA